MASRPWAFHGLGRFDDEGGGVRVELVGVRLEPAMLGLFEREGESVELLLGAQPHEAALAQIDVGLVNAGVAGADAAVEAVAGDDQVGVYCAASAWSSATSVSNTSSTPSPGTGPAGC